MFFQSDVAQGELARAGDRRRRVGGHGGRSLVRVDEFDRWSGGPAAPHNSIAACLARSRSGCLGAALGVVAWAATWRLSQSRKSFSTIANSELLIGSMWSSLMIRSSPDLSASRTTAAALPVLTLRRWQTSAMACPNDSNEGVGSTALSF